MTLLGWPGQVGPGGRTGDGRALCHLGMPSTGHTQWLLINPRVFPSGALSPIFGQPKRVGFGSRAVPVPSSCPSARGQSSPMLVALGQVPV